jgi:hypothetical protein
VHNSLGGKMAKRKTTRKKATKVSKNNNIDFHSWTFFLFAIFVLLVVMILVGHQHGLRIFHPSFMR